MFGNTSCVAERHIYKHRIASCRVPNPIILWAFRVGEAYGGAAGCRGAEQNVAPTGEVALQVIVLNRTECLFASTKQEHFI